MTQPLTAEEPSSSYLFEFGGQFFKGARSLDGYRLYSFEHVDELTFMQDAIYLPDDVIERAKSEFLDAGWEGDGTLQVAWIPPFASEDIAVTQGAYVIHVKQSNNGTSWLLSPITLPRASLVRVV